MNFPIYPAYKDSGVEWLGRVPAHWTITSLRHTAVCLDKHRVPLNREERSKKQGSVPYWGANGIVDFVDDSLLDGDFVLLGEDGAPFFQVGKTVAFVSHGPIWPNNHVHVLRANKGYEPNFLAFALNVTEYANFIDGSTRDKLTQDSMKSIPLPMPSAHEQRLIAEFLDRQTGKLDALAAEQEILLTLLEEKRAATIAHAVTRGLDPAVKLKDSGVEWLGRVPTQWKMIRFKRLVKMPMDYGANEAADHDTPGNPRFVRITDIADDGTLREATFRSLPMETARPFLLKEGDLLFARSGATVGKSFHYNVHFGPCCFAGYLIRVRLDEQQAEPSFVKYITQSAYYWAYIGSEQIQATIPNVSAERYGGMVFAIPELDEQRRIIASLNATLGNLNALATKVQASIALLRERRAALISAAVTGRINVCGAAAKSRDVEMAA